MNNNSALKPDRKQEGPVLRNMIKLIQDYFEF